MISMAIRLSGIFLIYVTTLSLQSLAASTNNFTNQSPSAEFQILADQSLLERFGVQAEELTFDGQVGYAKVDAFKLSQIHEFAHVIGKCGGFELVESSQPLQSLNQALQATQVSKDLFNTLPLSLPERADVRTIVDEFETAELRETVAWLSSYPSRYHKLTEPNVHVQELATKLNTLLESYRFTKKVEMVAHSRTPQKSVRVTLTGKTFPDQIVVLGGHLDSIVQFSPRSAPGADDNASGSANVLQALKGFLSLGVQPERTIEFYWYAGEEGGLIGSSEIAAAYKAAGKDVVAAMQLDMSLFPADGEFVMGSINDYTSPWLRNFLGEINRIYIGARVKESACGYACSDHASWYRNGYPTLFPFEASGNNYNRSIHTTNDVISATSNFEHSLMFSKVAFVFVYEFGLHEWRPTP